MIKVQIHDEELKRHLKQSPARANWANREAFKMSGGHFKKKLRSDIEQGKTGGPQGLHPLKKGSQLTPLHRLGRMVRFTVGKYKGNIRLLIGFLPGKKKFRFGDKTITIPALAAIHEGGKRFKITTAMRRFFAAAGRPLRRSTKYLTIPARPMVEPFYNRERQNIPAYIKKRFYEKFFGKQRPDLGV